MKDRRPEIVMSSGLCMLDMENSPLGADRVINSRSQPNVVGLGGLEDT
jgi:hypothetical protein